MTLLRIIDFETTGLGPEAVVCEAAWVDVNIDTLGQATISRPERTFVSIKVPMPFDARGVHHISNADLAGAPTFSAVIDAVTVGPPLAFVAHEAAYEMQFLSVFFGGVEVPWICTKKVALRIEAWADCPNYKNQTLRYYLGLDDKIAGFSELAMPPHRAAPDTWVTAHILVAALAHASIEQMIAWSAEPALMRKINFGSKYRGQPWSEAELDYLEWIVAKSELDEDTKWNARREMDRRRMEAKAAYFTSAIAEIKRFTTAEELKTWFLADRPLRARHQITPDSKEYADIVAACVARKAELVAMPAAAEAAHV